MNKKTLTELKEEINRVHYRYVDDSSRLFSNFAKTAAEGILHTIYDMDSSPGLNIQDYTDFTAELGLELLNLFIKNKDDVKVELSNITSGSFLETLSTLSQSIYIEFNRKYTEEDSSKYKIGRSISHVLKITPTIIIFNSNGTKQFCLLESVSFKLETYSNDGNPEFTSNGFSKKGFSNNLFYKGESIFNYDLYNVLYPCNSMEEVIYDTRMFKDYVEEEQRLGEGTLINKIQKDEYRFNFAKSQAYFVLNKLFYTLSLLDINDRMSDIKNDYFDKVDENV